MLNNRLLKLFTVLCAVAFLDAAYLTFIHYAHLSVVCPVGNGCDIVSQSQYAAIGPVPVALVGVLYFGFLSIAVFFSIKNDKREYLMPAFYLSLFGALGALRFIYLQIFVLHALCPYCLFADTIALVLPLICFKFYKRADNPAIDLHT